MKINFLEIAQIELDAAIEYYNYEVSGLGDSFLNEVLNALDRIGEFPEA
jgi:toxin ParE2